MTAVAAVEGFKDGDAVCSAAAPSINPSFAAAVAAGKEGRSRLLHQK